MLKAFIKLISTTKLSYFLTFFCVSLLATFIMFQQQTAKFYQLSRKGLDNVDWTFFQIERSFDPIYRTLLATNLNDKEKLEKIQFQWDLFSSAIDTAQGPSFVFLLDYAPKNKQDGNEKDLTELKLNFQKVDQFRTKMNEILDKEGWSDSAYRFLTENYLDIYEKVEVISLRANQRTAMVSSDKQKDLDGLELGVTVAYFAQAAIIFGFTIWGIFQIKAAQKHSAEIEAVNNALESSNSELKASKEQLMSAFKDRSLFIAKSSHELRTPLNSIVGFIDLALVSIKDGVEKTYLAQAQESAQHLMHLTEDILQYSKLDNITFSYEMVNLKEAVEAAIGLMVVNMERTNFRVYDFVAEDISVWVDNTRLKQIILNLVSNAIKYAGPNQSLTISTEFKEDQVIVYFRDTGPGISPELAPILFTPFTRGVNVDSDIPGTGIGLSTSLKLAQTMGGNLKWVPDNKEGACFELSIPYLGVYVMKSHKTGKDGPLTTDIEQNCCCEQGFDIFDKSLDGVIILGVFKDPDVHNKVSAVFSKTNAQYMLMPDWEYVKDIYAEDGMCWVVTDSAEAVKELGLEVGNLIEVQSCEDLSKLAVIKEAVYE